MIAHRLRPKWLKPSAEVDIRQVLAKLRPALRTELEIPVTEGEFKIWRKRLGLYGIVDKDGFVVLSMDKDLCYKIMSIDQSPKNHTAKLGLLLGYPTCCIRAAARIGEASLDNWAMHLIEKGFQGEFTAIDISGYLKGQALISHIPCSTKCSASLKMANSLKMTLRDEAHLGSISCTQ